MTERFIPFILSSLIAFMTGFLVPGRANAQSFRLSTNLADCANLGTLNLEAAYGMSRHWSLSASVKYNPFEYGDEDAALQSKQRSVSVGARYWPWHVYSGWWASGDLRYQEYRTVAPSSPLTTQGDR